MDRQKILNDAHQKPNQEKLQKMINYFSFRFWPHKSILPENLEGEQELDFRFKRS